MNDFVTTRQLLGDWSRVRSVIVACFQLGWPWTRRCFFLTCVKWNVTRVSVYHYIQLKCSVYRYIVDICTIPIINLSFTTFSPDSYFINSGSLVAWMVRHQCSHCLDYIRLRHTRVGICERARQWTVRTFTTPAFPYLCWKQNKIPHSVHCMGSEQNSVSELSNRIQKYKTEQYKLQNL